MIESIDHLVITVRDLDATLAFYEKLLDCSVIREPDRPTALVFGSCKINVHEVTRTFEPKAKAPAPGAADFCLIADCPLAEVIRRLQQNGVAIELGPVSRTGARGEMTSVYFRDPDGNLIEVSEYPD
jgi:catechol 2,3-dioxygenase-like lactoylglutathione lyase family enzyme